MVPVLVPHGVSAEILRDFGEQQIGTSGIAGAGNATRSRDVYGSPRYHPAFLEQRRDREQNGSRVATWIRHDLSPWNLCAHQFGKTIRRFSLIDSDAGPRSEVG